jgi:hypothetical protein
MEHGLIASLSDLSTSASWSNVTGSLIGATAESPSNGMANTNAIIAQGGQTVSAALLCHNYNGGGYTDWYLPAIWELTQCYTAAGIVNRFLGDTNGLHLAIYWSSTETADGIAWNEPFNFGYAGTNGKSNTYSVRAVRRY